MPNSIDSKSPSALAKTGTLLEAFRFQEVVLELGYHLPRRPPELPLFVHMSHA